MKIAVCLFGQLRTAEYCAPWIKETFNFSDYERETSLWKHNKHWHKERVYEKYTDPIEIDYFCDFKTVSFTSNDISAKKIQHNSVDIDKIRRLYNPAGEHITPENIDISLRQDKPFMTPMFSSICRTVLLKQEHEIKNNFIYDAVFLHRYDVLSGPSPNMLRESFHQNGIQPLCIYGMGGANHRFLNEGFRAGFLDMIFWGDSFSIDALSARLYQYWATDNLHHLKHEFSHGPNTALSIAANDAGLSYEPAPISYSIVRDTADLTIPVFDSFFYHTQYYLKAATWNQPPSIKLIAFDLDGVIANTEDFHYLSLLDSIRKHTSLCETEIIQIIKKDGTSTKTKLKRLKDVHNINDEVLSQIDLDKQDNVLQHLENLSPSITQQEMFSWIKSNNYYTALVSNSRIENVSNILSRLGIKSYFDFIITPTEGVRPKPDPDMYNLTINTIKVDPQETLIFEDSPAGIEAAVKSGAFVLPINNIEQVNLNTLKYVINEANNINSHGGKRNQILTSRI